MSRPESNTNITNFHKIFLFMFKNINLKYLDFFKWIIVAGLTSIIDILVFYFLIHNNLSLVFSNLISFLISTQFNFLAHYFWTFKNRSKSNKTLFVYFFSLSISWALNTFLLFLISKIFILPIAKIIANLVMVPVNFLLMSKFTFKS